MTAPAKGEEWVPHPVKEQFPGVEFCVNSNPSWPEAIVLAFQHYLVMLGTAVVIASIIVPQMGGDRKEKAKVVQTMLFVSGVNTLLQTWFGTRLPVVIGGSFRFVIPTLYIALCNRYSYYIDDHNRYLSPLSAVPLVTLVGLGLYAEGFPLLAECVEVGLPELIIIVLFSQYVPYWWKSKWFNRFAILLAVAIVWAYAALLTAAGAYKNKPPRTQLSCRVDRAGLVGGASWIDFPYPFQWGRPSLYAGDAFVMLAAAFVSLIESTGTFIAAARYSSATHVPSSVLGRGAGWLGISLLLDGLWGTASGSTASVENVGLLALSRVGSRRVVQLSTGFMFFFSILGKFGAVIASIPLPIVGALYCVLFGYMSSAGLGLLQFCNLNSYRTKFILGFSLFLGLSVPQYFNGYVVTTGRGPVRTKSMWFNEMMLVIFTSPATVAAIVAVFLDLTLGRNEKEARKDSGRHWWAKFRHFDKDPRSEEFYSLPYGLSKYFPSL